MTKLYRYRPLSDLLFKELHYQELYFASYEELNDPLDLSARIDFTPKDETSIGFLLWFIIKTSITSLISESVSKKNKETVNKLASLNNNEELRTNFKKAIYEEVIKLKAELEFLDFKLIKEIILRVSDEQKIDFPADLTQFQEELKRLTKVFIENSHAACFSEINDDFLMWSHYSSKHSGICLEFTLQHKGQFPYEMVFPRKSNMAEYEKRVSEYSIETHTFWDRIHQVTYRAEQPIINFFEFAAVFANEGDVDLMELSKSRWHGYAFELELIFSTKTLPWAYEKEWRAIEIKFGDPEFPEEKVRHYPIEALSAIYFGIRTPLSIKRRISNIYKRKKPEMQFFDCRLSNGRELLFEEWEDEE